MKILILGGEGMFGSGLVKNLSSSFELAYTVHLQKKTQNKLDSKIKRHENVNAFDMHSMAKVFADFRPDIVINAIGIVKQKVTIDSEVETIELNALFPFKLQKLCELMSCKLILLSTDCVFKGDSGNYSEESFADANDLYGKTKILGEICDRRNVLTIRTSTIGLELASNKGLIEWFLSQTGTISGYTKAIYSGFVMSEFSKILSLILLNHTNLCGLYHISSNPISKYELLNTLKNKINKKDINVKIDDTFICDRSLDSSKFRSLTKYVPPSWDAMLDNLAEEILKR